MNNIKKTKHIVLNTLLIVGGAILAFIGVFGIYSNITDGLEKDASEIGVLPFGLVVLCIGIMMIGSGIVNLRDGDGP